MEQPDAGKQPTRTQGDYANMTHSILINHLKTEIKKSKHKSPVHKLNDYLTKRIWAWFYYYLISRFGKSYPYQTYTGAHTGIYSLGNGPVTIGITSDWATDTRESIEVAKKMGGHNPDYTVHLGDTYFVGAPQEIAENFIGPGSPWVRGSKGSFAVLGNHEMYARGTAFFKRLLPTLGIKNANGHYDGQKAGFFCLENEHWRILGLDTGYHSIGKVPVLELFSRFSSDCHFDKKLMEWLYATIKLGDKNDKRGLLILTHHQYITAFENEGEYLAPAKQLAQLIGKDRPVLWIWGHEHKLSIFEKAQVHEGITAYGRCIGHGGMPVELNSSTFIRSTNTHGSSKLVMVDTRKKPGTSDYPLGYNGYVLLSLDNDNLNIAYYDTKGEILSESWVADVKTGMITGSIEPPSHPHLLPCEKNKAWEDAVK